MKITFDLPTDVMRDIAAALANAIAQGCTAAERNAAFPHGCGPEWATAEDDVIALDVLNSTLCKVISEAEVG